MNQSKHLLITFLCLVLLLSGCSAPAPTDVTSESLTSPAVYIYKVESSGERILIFGVDNSQPQYMEKITKAFTAETRVDFSPEDRADYVVSFADRDPKQTVYYKVWLDQGNLIFQFQAPLNKIVGDDQNFYQSKYMTAEEFQEILS